MQFEDLKAISDDLSDFESVSKLKGYVSTREKEKERIQQAKDGTIPQGLSTGYNILDMYFRFKRGNLVIINGHANVGKSFMVWYLAVISAKLHKWKWIFFCGENQSADIRRQIVEFLGGSLARYMDENLFNKLLEFAYEYFEIIELDESKDEIETADMIRKISEDIIEEKGSFDGLLVDPYNSLEIDISNLDRRLSTHDYHYRVLTKFRKFNKKHNITTWINMHAVTESLRRIDKDGYPLPPKESDTEGGGKSANRSDEFMTFHRYVQDSSRSSTTEIHVRKVKDTYTGGKPSDLNNPIKLTWHCHNKFHGFYDENGECALADKKAPENIQIQKFPDANGVKDFDNEIQDLPF